MRYNYEKPSIYLSMYSNNSPNNVGFTNETAKKRALGTYFDRKEI